MNINHIKHKTASINIDIDIEQLEKELPSQQFVAILKYIAKDKFNLDSLLLEENKCLDNIKALQKDIDDINTLYDTQINIYNKIKRLDLKKRTTDQFNILKNYSINTLSEQQKHFRRAFVDFLEEEKEQLKLTQIVKNIFLQCYPEAVSSPSSTPSQILEMNKSPPRFSKSISSPTLSPRKLLLKNPLRRSQSRK